MKQKLFSLLALFLFVSIGLTTDTKADSMGNELNSSVSENLKALDRKSTRLNSSHL